MSELTGILGIAQSGVSRHLGLLKDAGLIVEQREGGYTYFRPAPTLARRRERLRAARRAPPGRVRRRRADRDRPRRRCPAGGSAAAAQGELRRACRSRHERASARARPELGRLVAGARPPAAAAARRRHRMRRGLSDRRGQPLGVARDRGRSLGARPEAGARARHAPARAQRDLEARRAREAAAPRRQRRRGAPVAGAAPCARSGPRAGRSGAHRRARAGACWCSTCASTTRSGSRTGSAIAGSGFSDDALAKLLKGAGLTDVRVNVGARRTGDPFTVIVASGMKPVRSRRSKRTRRPSAQAR